MIVAACDGGTGTPPEDSGVDAAGDAALEDAAPDVVEDAAPPLEMSDYFQPCLEDSQCPGEGGVCRTDGEGAPGGYCTKPCTVRGDCDLLGAYQHCVADASGASHCEYRCSNGVDCGRPGWTCDVNAPLYRTGDFVNDDGMCFGVCDGDESCSPGYVCDANTSICVLPEDVVTTGAALGDACAADDACSSSVCIEDNQNGWLEGACLSFCILPLGYNNNTFFFEDTLPQASCPEGGICFPNGSNARGDYGACLLECTSDADCRPGLTCLNEVEVATGPRVFTNGVCVPGDCRETSCPDGYTCRNRISGGRRLYYCDR